MDWKVSKRNLISTLIVGGLWIAVAYVTYIQDKIIRYSPEEIPKYMPFTQLALGILLILIIITIGFSTPKTSS
ncbi:MAG: hypothetical protein ACTSYM_13745 [Candidatus Baldrarchaeia archaeon]